MSDQINKIDKRYEKLKGMRKIKEYIPFVERITGSNENKKEKKEYDYETSDLGIARVIDKSYDKILDFPILSPIMNLVYSTFEHDIYMMDLLHGSFVRYKHVDGVATRNGKDVIINLSKSIALNESEKRNPLLNILKRKNK